MDRPVKMTGPSLLAGNVTIDHAKDATYGAAGQMTSMKYLQWQDSANSGTPYYFTEEKEYNTLYQLTRQKTTGTGVTAAEIEYTFSPTANNGRISGRKNYQLGVSGEDVVYSYDELNRLVSASVTGTGGWGQAFTYDGFGNLWSQAVTKGTAPSVYFHFEMATNRINTYPQWTYDANGNTTGMDVQHGTAPAGANYDADNRMSAWFRASVGTEEYAYLADNKRAWKKGPRRRTRRWLPPSMR